jgi:hypothetical protein
MTALPPTSTRSIRPRAPVTRAEILVHPVAGRNVARFRRPQGVGEAGDAVERRAREGGEVRHQRRDLLRRVDGEREMAGAVDVSLHGERRAGNAERGEDRRRLGRSVDARDRLMLDGMFKIVMLQSDCGGQQ